MTFTLTRQRPTVQATLGTLTADMVIFCVTLEDPPGDGKGPIPAGTYPLVLTYSNRFQQLLPEILHVPNRTGIRIHAGNKKDDTEGCVLLGSYIVGPGEVGASREAMAKLLRVWRQWDQQTITIVDAA